MECAVNGATHALSAMLHDSTRVAAAPCPTPARRMPDSPSQTKHSSSKVKVAQRVTVGGGIGLLY